MNVLSMCDHMMTGPQHAIDKQRPSDRLKNLFLIQLQQIMLF